MIFFSLVMAGQWTIIKFKDDGIIALKKLDLRSNEGHDEEAGDLCVAKYHDNEYYSATILLITG